ncbi:MAG: ABC transporter ATP-binding protein [Firmicutes bacterium]|nr:ABC transporter ATP-binding protein [Bacillota bacterium]
MKLQVENLSFAYDQEPVIENISITVKKGEFVGLIGPNGSGKSTILKNLYRALQPKGGVVKLDGDDLFKLNYKQAAKKIGVVGQENSLPFDFTVEEIVAMGRSPYKKIFDGDTLEDKEIINKSLAYMGIAEMAKRNYLHLSGGEKQRVLLARAIAQQTDFLLLDEPTNHLDIGYQIQILDFVKNLKVTVLAALHDLNLAAMYCNRLYVLKNGCIYKSGTPEEVLTPEIIYDVYGIRADVSVHPVTKKLTITFLPGSLNIN